MSLRLNY